MRGWQCACRLRTDFPPEPPVTQKQSMVRHEFLEVTTTAEIESDAHYLEELSRFNIQATQHEARVIQEQFGSIDHFKKTFEI